jgi:hypothetical protein
MTSSSIKRLNFEMLFGFRSVVTLRTNIGLPSVSRSAVRGSDFFQEADEQNGEMSGTFRLA